MRQRSSGVRSGTSEKQHFILVTVNRGIILKLRLQTAGIRIIFEIRLNHQIDEFSKNSLINPLLMEVYQEIF
jgi:hypothetical protein